jgi:hypothetical protein
MGQQRSLPHSAIDENGKYPLADVLDFTKATRLFDLADTLGLIVPPLIAAGVPHEVIGGLAVLLQVEQAKARATLLPSNPSVVAHNVDLLVDPADLPRLQQIAQEQGFHCRRHAGLEVICLPGIPTWHNVVHVVCSGEKVCPEQVEPHPPPRPVPARFLGVEVRVVPVADLVRMKLSAYRDKDRVHIRNLDAAGLITREVENALLPELEARLRHIRSTA